MRTCTRCKTEMPTEMFFRCASKKSGFASHCKNCVSVYLNSEKTKQRRKAYSKEYNSKYIKSEKGKISWAKAQEKYVKSGKHQAKRKERMQKNPSYKLSLILRIRLLMAISGKHKSGSAIKYLGCDIEFLKTYIEKQFTEGMTWENHGLYGWHIDHIRPLSSFDLTDENQLYQACGYKNLRPLWAIDNLRKGKKLL